MKLRTQYPLDLPAGIQFQVLEERFETRRRWRWSPWPRVEVRVILRVRLLGVSGEHRPGDPIVGDS